MRKHFLMGILSMLLMASCNNKSKSKTEATNSPNETEITTADLEQAWSLIALDGTQRWLVNKEMKPYVKKGEELVNNFIKSDSKDYKELGIAVTDQNNNLIKSCTMDGKSHDELHNWLHPHLEITKALTEEADKIRARELVSQLQESYKQYHLYFN